MRFIAVLLAALTIVPTLAFANSSCPDGGGDDIDLFHPKHFVDVTEVARNNKRFRIFESCEERQRSRGIPGQGGLKDETLAEFVSPSVDRRSRISITFDRKWIRANAGQFDAEVLISAHVKGTGDAEIRPIEVHGYSQIGEEYERATARIRSTKELAALLGEVSRRANDFYDLVYQLDLEDEEKTRFRSSTDALTDDGIARRIVPRLVDRLLASRSVWTVPLTRFTSPEDRQLIEALADVKRRDADVLQALARDVLRAFDSIEALSVTGFDGDEELEEARLHLLTIQQDIDELGQLAFSSLEGSGELQTSSKSPEEVFAERTTEYFLGFLKDTDIFVPTTGAKSGDDIVVRISNGNGTPELHRDFVLSIKVEDFGFAREITDSFFFLKRSGVDESDDVVADDSMAESDGMGDGSMGMDMTGSMESPRDVNYEPAPGVTLAWTYRPRRQHGRFMQTLAPGFGVNVSFPRFGSRVTSFDFGDPSADPPTVTRATVEESSDEIEVASGLVLTLFDNALQFTYGWNLNVDEKREYFGVGFSFVELIRKVKNKQ